MSVTIPIAEMSSRRPRSEWARGLVRWPGPGQVAVVEAGALRLDSVKAIEKALTEPFTIEPQSYDGPDERPETRHPTEDAACLLWALALVAGEADLSVITAEATGLPPEVYISEEELAEG